MRRVVLVTPESEFVNLGDLNSNTPIFAKENGVLKGMAVQEPRGWIVRTGGSTGSCGHRDTLEDCLNASSRFYEFYIE